MKMKDGSSRLMIIESAQINLKDKEQKKVFDHSTHFNPVDLVCGVKTIKARSSISKNSLPPNKVLLPTNHIKGKKLKYRNSRGFGMEQ